MEFLGYAFSLPMEMHMTIKRAIRVYNEWLGLTGRRPPCIDENESWYLKEILCHFSILFDLNDYEPKIHVELCD
jgi:hypothetical protein